MLFTKDHEITLTFVIKFKNLSPRTLDFKPTIKLFVSTLSQKHQLHSKLQRGQGKTANLGRTSALFLGDQCWWRKRCLVRQRESTGCSWETSGPARGSGECRGGEPVGHVQRFGPTAVWFWRFVPWGFCLPARRWSCRLWWPGRRASAAPSARERRRQLKTPGCRSRSSGLG